MNAMIKLSLVSILFLSTILCYGQSRDIFKITYLHPEPVIAQGDKGTEGNMYGFEGGRAIYQNKAFHLFTTEMIGKPIWAKTNFAHWTSKDGLSWERQSTLMASSANFDGTDTHAALWSPMPTYSEEKDKWVITYVCYRSKPNTKKQWFRNYDGRIAIAESVKSGKKGIAGPYLEKQLLMKPDTLAPALGLMGVDSFYPYQVNGDWYSFYGSSPEWVGLAKAESLYGDWKRMSESGIVSKHTENPMVTQLEDGRYVAFFDGCGVYQKFGYLISEDGINWEGEPVIIDLDDHPNKWWGLSRTPLGLIPEGKGKYRLYFTAYNKNYYTIPGIWALGTDDAFDEFYASVGMIKLELIDQ